MPEIIIVGGGISGAASAYELAREGHEVTLLEARNLAAMASGWTLGGVRQSGRHPAELPLARAAVERWGGLAERLGSDVSYRRQGNLRLARDEREREIVRALVDAQRAAGLEIELLDGAAEVQRVAPALHGRIVAASYCASDGHADPVAAVRGFAQAAARAGAVIREGVTVTRVLTEGGAVQGVDTDQGPIGCDRVVVAAGVHAPALVAPLTLPIAACRVAVLQTVPVAPVLDQVFGVANADCAGRQERDGRLRVTTGVVPFEGSPRVAWEAEDFHPSAREVSDLIERVGSLLPALASARVSRVWGGLIDLTPDALPVLDAPEDLPGLVIAAGFSGHGFCLGPVTGEVVADLVLGRPPRLPIDPFRLDRLRESRVPDQSAAPTLHG